MLAYFFYPAYSLAKAERKRIVEVNARIMLDTNVKASVGEVEGNNFLLQSLNDPANVLAALRSAGYEKVEGISIVGAEDQTTPLYAIRRRVIENKSATGTALKETSRIYAVTLDKGVVSIVFKNEESGKASVFVNAVVERAEAELRAFVLPYAEEVVLAYERLISMPKPGEADIARIVQDTPDYAAAKKLLDGTLTLLFVVRKPYAFIPEYSIDEFRQNTLKTAVLLVFGVFFMAIFAAFVLQYIESVRKDAEAMAKIRAAMGKR